MCRGDTGTKRSSSIVRSGFQMRPGAASVASSHSASAAGDAGCRPSRVSLARGLARDFPQRCGAVGPRACFEETTAAGLSASRRVGCTRSAGVREARRWRRTGVGLARCDRCRVQDIHRSAKRGSFSSLYLENGAQSKRHARWARWARYAVLHSARYAASCKPAITIAWSVSCACSSGVQRAAGSVVAPWR